MKVRGLSIVFRKELMDGIRDRRSIYSLLASALIGPLLVGFLLNRFLERQRGAQDITIPVVGAEYAPSLMDWLRQHTGVQVADGPADAQQAVRDGKEDVVLIIDKDFEKNLSRAHPAEVKVVGDSTRSTARPKVQRVRRLLQRYSDEIGALRLITRGVSPVVARAIRIEEIEISSAQQRAAMIVNFIPMFLVLAAFVGGMQLAVDSTAGERERGSFEPLLLNPVPRAALVSGKWFAASTFGMAAVVINTMLCVAIIQWLPMHEVALRFRFGAAEIGGLLAVTVPVAFLAAALQVFVATFARSFKEAQSYLGMLIILPMLPGALAPIYPLSNYPWLAPVPILGQYVLANDILGGKQPALVWFILAPLATLIVGLVLVYMTARLFGRERIIFGR